jgi:hypothetical protein
VFLFVSVQAERFALPNTLSAQKKFIRSLKKISINGGRMPRPNHTQKRNTFSRFPKTQSSHLPLCASGQVSTVPDVLAFG